MEKMDASKKPNKKPEQTGVGTNLMRGFGANRDWRTPEIVKQMGEQQRMDANAGITDPHHERFLRNLDKKG